MARKIGSRYTAHQVIGRGSAGTVWLGEGPEGPVAIKLLREDLASDQVLVGRFVQERTALTSLDHPRVVGVHDLVVDGDDLALVMELVHGSDLRARLDREGPLTPQAAVSVVADVAEGLAVAHAAGIVHRDVKPENILLDQASSPGPGGAPRAKLSDFGIARLVDAPRRTRATRIIGTPDYLAPEVIEGLEPRAAVDIYALATVLYELLAGFTPFGGGHTGAVLRRHVTETVAPLPGLPEELWRVVAQCLSKAPASRLRASELAARLRELLPSLAGLPVLSVSHPDAPPAAYPAEYDDEDADDRDGSDDGRERRAPGDRVGVGPGGGAGSGPAAGGRRRRGPAVPLVPGAQPDSSRDTHTSLRRPSPEELVAFADASRQERAARAGRKDGGHRHAGAKRSGAGAAVRRRRRLLAAALALLVVAGAAGAYKAFAGDSPGPAGKPSQDGRHSAPGSRGTRAASAATLGQAPVAGKLDSTAPPAAVPLPGWTAWATAPAPPVPLVSGLRAVDLDGTAYVFGTDADGYIRYLTRGATAFGGWGKLTGIQVTGEPAAVALPDGRLRLFARGTDGLVYQRTLVQGRWSDSAWGKLDGGMRVDSPPAAAVHGDRIDLVARIGSDLATTSYSGSGAWSVWQTVGTAGRITGAPALVAESSGRIDAFVLPAGGGPVLRTQAVNGLWRPAQPVTGVTATGAGARPEAVQTAGGAQYVFAASGAEAAGSAGGALWTSGTLPGAAGEPAACTDATGVALFLRTAAGGVAYAHTR
ncbi:protein kinase domain-containing protein [Streptacidiphilus cavernicola]|uniref:Protein kinase n=1 Tax=Streptacidiphilus cavernicola TaxID=3342716 RepID=A0ABV6VZU4_9ACTN